MVPVTSRFLIHPETLYSQKGARYEEAGEELTFKFDDVKIPVLLKARCGSGGARPDTVAFMGRI